MTTPPRRQAIHPLISRQFEFSRLQAESIISAYKILIPVPSGHGESPRRGRFPLSNPAARPGVSRSSAVGA
jgi:hypothetical protein